MVVAPVVITWEPTNFTSVELGAIFSMSAIVKNQAGQPLENIAVSAFILSSPDPLVLSIPPGSGSGYTDPEGRVIFAVEALAVGTGKIKARAGTADNPTTTESDEWTITVTDD